MLCDDLSRKKGAAESASVIKHTNECIANEDGFRAGCYHGLAGQSGGKGRRETTTADVLSPSIISPIMKEPKTTRWLLPCVGHSFTKCYYLTESSPASSSGHQKGRLTGVKWAAPGHWLPGNLALSPGLSPPLHSGCEGRGHLEPTESCEPSAPQPGVEGQGEQLVAHTNRDDLRVL